MKIVFSTVVFALALAMQPVKAASVLKAHQGRWLGDLKIPDGPTLKLGAELFDRADGTAWASVASPDQDAYDIAVIEINERAETVDLKLPFATLTLTWETDHFMGVWKQGPTPVSFKLRKVQEFPMKARPQTPKAPFPYKNETLAIPVGNGITLGATLAVPDRVDRPNVVILVAGSGPSTRDAQLFGHQTFVVLSDYLARRGIAVLRYDKRGISRSTGNFESHTMVDLGNDLRGVVQSLRARGQFKRIGLVGHSEGSQVAAAIAAQDPKAVDFIVSLAGVGVRGVDLLLAQDRIWAGDHGASPAEAERAMVYVRQYYAAVLAEADPIRRVAALKALYDELSPEDMALIQRLKMNHGTLSREWAEKPFLRASLQSDPSSYWRAVKSPVLALHGSLDHQVPGFENLGGIVAALGAAENRRVESKLLPSLNHLFQTASTGRDDEYGVISETMSPIVMKRVATFVHGIK